MVCLFRQKDVEKNKDYKKSVLSFFAALVILAAAVGAVALAYDFSRTWFDSEGNRYIFIGQTYLTTIKPEIRIVTILKRTDMIIYT